MAESLVVLKTLCVMFPDVQVTIQDSINAGNCEDRTREFADKYFLGRETVTVKELAEFMENRRLENRRVAAVLRHVLHPLVSNISRFYLWYRDPCGSTDRWFVHRYEGYAQKTDASDDKLRYMLVGCDVRVLPAGQEPE